MRIKTVMQRGLLILLLVLMVSLAACSYSMDYVVVNASGNTVNVTYMIRPTGSIDPLAATGMGIPAMLPVSELPGREWRALPSTQFSFDLSNRTVTVSLPPNQGLLITRGAEWRPDSPTGIHFIISEINITGSNGKVTLEGAQVYKSFAVVPKPFYRFGPPTLAIMTYK